MIKSIKRICAERTTKMLNTISLIGRLTALPEARKDMKGNTIAQFDLANNGIKTDKGEETLFIRTIVFGKGAEACLKYLGKGSLVSVTGRLHAFTYTNKKTNAEVKGFEIIANSVEFVDTGKKTTKPEETKGAAEVKADN